MSLTADIKAYALSIGYDRCGIAAADDFTEYEQVLTDSGEANAGADTTQKYDWWLQGPRKPLEWAHPKKEVPFAKSIIALVYDYGKVDFPPELTSMIGRVYLSRCYNPPANNIHYQRFELMKQFLADRNIQYADGAWLLPERWATNKAGITTFGKNTVAQSKGLGSFIKLNTIIVDAELELDEANPPSVCPANCTRCLDACPTQALYEPFRLDPRRCIAFNNWMTANGRGFGITDSIPEDIREGLGTRLHGCDACQEACPQNKVKLSTKYPKDAFLEQVKGELTLPNILHMRPGFYESHIQPLMYNYIKDIYLFQRNAAVAMGNKYKGTGDKAAIAELKQELDHPEEAVREHVQWALEQIQT